MLMILLEIVRMYSEYQVLLLPSTTVTSTCTVMLCASPSALLPVTTGSITSITSYCTCTRSIDSCY
jgi:hypothetical protein